MDRKQTTKLLTDTLVYNKLSDRKYYAKEVTLDYGTTSPKRVDIMQFEPAGVTYASDIEKGIFICYEIKSCKADVYSGHGLRFYGEKNYIVTTMSTYKELQDDICEGTLDKYIKEHYPESSLYYGFLVPVPASIDLRDSQALYAEFENPSEFSGDPSDWKLHAIYPCIEGRRTRSMNELLFCMLRAKHSDTNQN